MPRSLRLEFPGAFYHVMARGNRRETIFHDDDDRWLAEGLQLTGLAAKDLSGLNADFPQCGMEFGDVKICLSGFAH